MTPTNRWRVVSASVEGTSHRARGGGCQDSHASRALPDGTLIIAVADGAGSAPRSAEGATRAAAHIVASLRRMLLKRRPVTDEEWERVMRRAFLNARLSVLAVARGAGRRPRDFATTLTCAVLTAELIVVGQIGDGLVVVQTHEGELLAPVRPQRGEYANETGFLTMPGMTHGMQVAVVSAHGRAVAAITDGLIRLATRVPDYQPFPRFYAPLFAFVDGAVETSQAAAALVQFLDSARVNERTDDDKTLLLAARIPEPELHAAELALVEGV